jgi:hypothetical protein
MMTTFNVGALCWGMGIGRRLAKALIIGTVLLAAAGCSSLRLAYNNGGTLAWWWIDGYLDFGRDQAPLARAAIDRYLEWHRGTQLTEYAALLTSAQQLVMEPTTPAAACRFNQRAQQLLDPAFERALVQGAELVPSLGEAQFKALEKKYARVNEEMRRDYLQSDPAERQRKTFERTLERAEQVYGRLDEAQMAVIKAGMETSPFDPQAWLAERQRRQRDVLATLRALKTDNADAATRERALRALGARMERSPDAAYAAYQLKLRDYNCGFAAQLHNATTVAQRQKARENLKGWEEDLRALAAERSAGTAVAAPRPGGNSP